MANIFTIKNTYSFNTLDASILDSRYESVEVVSTTTYEEAIKYRDIQTVHNDMKSKVTNLPESVRDCSFVLFKTLTGERVLLANEWLDINSVVLKNLMSYNIRVDNAGVDDMNILRNRLLELGYTNFEITVA